MKLYFMKNSCALAAQIVAAELGLNVDPVQVLMPARRTEDGRDYTAINPKGYVPALLLDDGQLLTENGAILQFLADQRSGSQLAPPAGTLARVRLQEALHYIGTDLHRGYKPLFEPDLAAAERTRWEGYLQRQYAMIDQQLARHRFVLGNDFSCADAYLYALTRWAQMVKLDLSAHTHVQAFMARVANRPAVHNAMRAQGLETAEVQHG